MQKLHLKDGTEFAVTDNIYGDYSVKMAIEVSDVPPLFTALTEDNLLHASIMDGGTVCHSFAPSRMESITLSADGGITLAITPLTETEIRLKELAEQLATHDMAIGDLGEAVSEIAEG